MTLTVSKLASHAGVKPDTIRYYERIGLLPEPTRTASGYRSYEPHAVDRLSFIKSSQRLGLKLHEIKELLELRDRGLCPCGHADDLIRDRLAEVDEEISRLQSLRSELKAMIADRSDGGRCVTEIIDTKEVRIWRTDVPADAAR